MSDYARAIRVALAAAGVTRAELADAIGLNPAAVSLWTSGRRSPRLEMLTTIADALSMPPFVLHVLAAAPGTFGAPEGFAALTWIAGAHGLQTPDKNDTIIATVATTSGDDAAT